MTAVSCGPEMHRHNVATITPEQRAARQRGKLDCSCNQCGFASASTARCNRCQSTDLRHFTHAENGGKCVAGAGGGEVSAETRQKRSEAMRSRRAAPQQTPLTAPEPPAALSAAGLSLWGES